MKAYVGKDFPLVAQYRLGAEENIFRGQEQMINTIAINGVAINETSYIRPGVDPSAFPFSVTVTEGRVFVMGDIRNASTDSRDSRLGMVDERYILGHVQSVVFPISDFGTVK